MHCSNTEYQLRKNKTRPDEDDGFGRYTLSRAHPRSRAFAAIPGGTIIGPVIEVQTVKILDQFGHEIAILVPNNSGHLTLGFPEERVGPWTNWIVPMPNSDTARDYSLNIRKADGGDSCLEQSKFGIQETGADHVSSQTSMKEPCADTLSITPSQAKNHSYE